MSRNTRDFILGQQPADLTVQLYADISWDASFDTIALGHTVYVNQLSQIDYLDDDLKKCIKYKKNIFAFAPLDTYNDKVMKIKSNGNSVVEFVFDNSNVVDNTFGSLNKLRIRDCWHKLKTG